LYCKLDTIALSYKLIQFIFLDNYIAKNAGFKANRRVVKFTTLKYLYEIAAIDPGTRMKYRQKLLSRPKTGFERKNSSNQKNVRLFDIINECIANDDMTKWDEDKICAELSISKNMLYCHKHYILKGLREFYFKWKEIEKKEIAKNNPDKIKQKFDRAVLMNEIGMKREAKNEFLDLCKTLESKKNRKIDDEILLLKSNEKLCFYYYHLNNRHKFNIFYSRIERLGRNLLKRNILKHDSFLTSEVNIVLYHCLLKKLGYYIQEQSTLPRIINLCKKILLEAKKANNPDLVCKMIGNIGSIYQDLMQFDKALDYNRKGMLYAQKHKMQQEEVCFKISIVLTEHLLGQFNNSECLTKMTELYETIKYKYLKDSVKERILYQFFCLGTVSNRSNTLSEFMEKYYSYNIIVRGYKSSVRMLYHKKFTHYLNDVFLYNYSAIPNSNKKSIIVKDINYNITAKLDDLVSELMSIFNKRHTVYFTIESYLFMLETEFCKGKNMDFEIFNDIYNKIKWILKTRSKIFQNDYELHRLISLFKSCSQIIEFSRYHNENEIVNKFGNYFDTFSDQLYDEKKENILPYFTFLSFTAEQSGCHKFMSMSDKLYFKLDKKYPDIFSRIKRQIESKMSSRISYA